MAKKPKIISMFNEEISPACQYCERGTESSDYKMILCVNEGMVSPYFKCKKFVYSPIKRAPKRDPALPNYDPSEFML